MNLIYHLLSRPYLWLFFMVSGVTGQTMKDSVNYSLDRPLDNLSEPNQLENLYDFWIGEWEVSWEEEDGNLGKGTNRIQKILDSTAIQEDFEVTQGFLKGFKGRSLSTYNRNLEKWKQVWIDNGGGYFEFTGKIYNNFPIFETDLVKRNGKEYKFRMVFKEIENCSLIWDWEMSPDNGKTWELKWRIFYSKM